MKLGLLIVALVAAATVLVLSPLERGQLVRPDADSNTGGQAVRAPTSGGTNEGRALAQQVCGSCHIFPEPELADRFTWTNSILPRMSYWLGYDTVDWTNEPGGGQVLASGKLPKEPVIDPARLKLIHNYYLDSAPPKPLPQQKKPPLKTELKHFRVRKSNYRKGSAMITMVKIHEQSKTLFA